MHPLTRFLFVAIIFTDFFCFMNSLCAQSDPVALSPGITITKVIGVPSECAGVAIDPVSQNFFYIRTTGEVHELIPNLSTFIDTLVASVNTLGVDLLQGMCFKDSSLFLIGNKMSGANTTQGLIMRGDLQSNGSRAWTQVMITDTIPLGSTAFDHGYNGIVVNPQGDSLYFNAGSRTDHGEIQDNDGAFPNTRDVPLTSAVFSIPINTENLLLPRDSTALAPYIFAEGTRNSFALAFNSFGELIALENSGDRDDPDEMNWLRKNHYYGFPWIMGGDVNPQQFPGYDPDADFMLNQHRYGYTHGFFYNDPTFPQMPPGLVITPGFSNTGPDADFFRDTISGLIMDASTSGIPVQTFTPHRSPVGLVFDLDSALSYEYRGDAFMLGQQLQGDSAGETAGGSVGTLLDSSQDLVHMKLVKNITGDNYDVMCERIVGDFYRPVSACMKGNHIYVIEYAKNDTSASIWDIEMPPYTGVTDVASMINPMRVFPNPFSDFIQVESENHPWGNVMLTLTDITGKILTQNKFENAGASIRLNDLASVSSGIYFLRIASSEEIRTIKLMKQ